MQYFTVIYTVPAVFQSFTSTKPVVKKLVILMYTECKNAMPCYDVRSFRILCAAVKTRNTFTAGQIKDLSYLNVLNAGNVISRENPCPALACWDVDEPDTESSNEEEEDAGLVSAASESKGEDHAVP